MNSTLNFEQEESLQCSSLRILIVEDYPPFRQFICSTLGGRRYLQVVGEVSDGLDAVQKAVELKPNLILLDIGLPRMSGIEAARQIRKLVPESKIVFLSQESSADVVEEAISMGAWGYVVKAKAASQLLAAVDAVISGKQFFSGLQGSDNFTIHLECDPQGAPSSNACLPRESFTCRSTGGK